MTDAIHLTLDAAQNLAQGVFAAHGVAPSAAASTARALVAAEADGQKGHGLSRIPSYAAQLRAGKVDGAAEPHLTKTAPAALRVDAGHGFAYPAIDLAIDALAPLAREQGVAIAAIVRSHHFGQAGAHCERLAEQGLVALIFGNSPKAMAPWGATRPLMGTNPIAFAAPLSNRAPLVIDLALSRAARGKIIAAQKAGEAIPEGWALDAQGRPATDPAEALKGSMVPIGEAKGAALAIMIEVLAAALTASHFGFEASSLFTEEGGPPDLGQTILAIDPAATSGGAFLARMDALVRAIENEPGARLPGMRRLEARARAERDGLAIALPLLEEIKALAS